MRLIAFKLLQSTALLVSYPFLIAGGILGLVWLITARTVGGIVSLWTFKPRSEHGS